MQNSWIPPTNKIIQAVDGHPETGSPYTIVLKIITQIIIKAIKQKLEKYKENNQKTLETKKYFKIFINKVKINKKENDYLKRKIFNIIKKNVIISKELKHYLNEAEEIN